MHAHLIQQFEFENNELIPKILESSLNGIVFHKAIRNSEGEIIDFEWIYLNQVALKMLGRSKEELLGNRMRNIYPNVVEEGIFEKYIDVIDRGKVMDLTFHYDKDGLNHWFRNVAVKQGDGMVVTITDISESKANEKKLVDYQNVIEGILNSSYTGIIGLKAIRENDRITGFKVKMVNAEAMFLFTGFHIGTPILFSDLKHLFLKELEDQIKDVITYGRIFKTEKEYVANGKKTWYKVIIKKWDDGAVINLVDITERKNSEKLVISILNSSFNGITLLSAIRDHNHKIVDLEYTMLNDVAAHILKKEPKDLKGKRMLEEFPGVANTDHFINYVKTIETGEPYRSEFFYPYEGYNAWYRVSGVKLGDGVVATFEDITSRKLAEQAIIDKNKALAEANTQLEQAQQELKIVNAGLEKKVEERTTELSHKNKELQRINQDLDNFVYVASHDLKSPLNNLEGLMDALVASKNLNDGDQEIINMMQESVNRFKNILDDLAEVAKVTSDKSEKFAEVSFVNLYEEFLENYKEQVKLSGAEFDTDFKISTMNFTPKNLRTILYNLLSNTLKYRSAERTLKVQISTSQIESYVVLSIKDNGQGIKKEMTGKIFAMFQRANSDVDGTGVGLAIIKRIVDNFGGKIELETEEGVGSTFKIYFPVFAV